MKVNQILNVAAWIAFALCIITYAVDDGLSNEPIVWGVAAIFLVIAPRHIGEAFN